MEKPYDEIKYRNCTIKCYCDPEPSDPRKNDNVTTFVCKHSRYNLGDRQDIETCVQELFEKCVSPKAVEMGEELELNEKLRLIYESGEVVMLPISMYEHSGISLWLGSTAGHPDACWDCSSIGFAYVERSAAEKEGVSDRWKEWANLVMECEMKVYDQYLRGEVYGFVAKDGSGEDIGSVWGYYEEADMIKDAKSEIDAYLTTGSGDPGQKPGARQKVC